MALLGGAHRLWGPVLGAVPLTLLFELLSARFPNYVHDHPRLHLPADRLRAAARRRRADRALAASRRSATADGRPHDRHGGTRVLEVAGLRRAFGGLVAVDDLGFAVAARRDHGPARPQRLGQDHGAQPDLGRAASRCRHDPPDGPGYRGPRRRTGSRGSASRGRSSSCACSTSHGLPRERHGGPRLPAAASARAPRPSARSTRCSIASVLRTAPAAGRPSSPISTRSGSSSRARSRSKPRLLLLDEWLAGLNPTELHDRHRR